MPSVGHSKRLRRIELRASPRIKAALARGEISARFADELLYCLPEEADRRLKARLADREEAVRRNRIAARVIKAHIDEGKRDLAALKEDLRLALASPTIHSAR